MLPNILEYFYYVWNTLGHYMCWRVSMSALIHRTVNSTLITVGQLMYYLMH